MAAEKPNARPSRTRIAALLALALLLIAVGWLGWRVYRVGGAAAALRADARAALALVDGDLQAIDLEQAASLLRTTQAHLQALQSAARPFLRLAPHMGWVPRYGPAIQEAPVFLDAAVDLTAAGRAIVDQLLPLLESAEGEAPSDGGSLLSDLTAALARTRPQFEQALTAVQQARAARARIDVDELDPRLRDGMARLDRYLPLLEQGLRAGLLAPDLLGADKARTYLLLVQNEDELRATGGFISGVARLTVDDGRIQEMAFEDSYAVDDFSNPYPEPPQPLQELMAADLWVFRDSNWSPDFPTAARQAIELYTISRDAPLQGVIALDQRAISLLLGPIGPLQVDGYDQPITGQNVLQMARRAWAPGEEIASDWWENRKDVMGDVLDAAIRRVQAGLTRQHMIGLSQAALQALRHKHLLLYLEDPAAAAIVRDLGWDGALAQPRGDYLMVVDVNVGFNKVNAVVEQRLHYTIDLTDPIQPQAALTVHHRHPVADWIGPCSQSPRYDATYQGMTERCYYDYLRVYAPSGAELRHATPHPVPGAILLSGERQPARVDVSPDQQGRAVFATFLVLRPGESLDTSFSYALPQTILQRVGDRWRYRLVVQKQPGTAANPLKLTVRLPAGADVVDSRPPYAERQAQTLHYRIDLRTDVALELTW